MNCGRRYDVATNTTVCWCGFSAPGDPRGPRGACIVAPGHTPEALRDMLRKTLPFLPKHVRLEVIGLLDGKP